jgi:hypothetical protein
MAQDNSGVQYVNNEGQTPTYSAALTAYNPYTTAQDVAVLFNPAGSGTLIKVTRILVSGTATAAATLPLYLYLRSALNTGGTSSAVNNSTYDNNDPTASGTLYSYSAVPTNNGTGRLVRSNVLILANASTPTGAAPPLVSWEFGNIGNCRQPHIRPGQCLALNLNGIAIPSGTSFYTTFEWAEVNGITNVY